MFYLYFLCNSFVAMPIGININYFSISLWKGYIEIEYHIQYDIMNL